MPGLIQGLETARRALLAHQASLNVTGHNLANVGTEGFTRRLPILRTAVPEHTPQGIIGNGVVMEGVRRARSGYLDTQLRKEAALAGRWEARSQILQQIEGVLGEPSDEGIGALLDDFFNSWLELSNSPEDTGNRTIAVQSGEALAQGIRDQDARFADLFSSTDIEVEQRVEQINAAFKEIAKLNLSIQTSEIGGTANADLRDERDRVLDQLATEVGATHLVRDDGAVVVRVGGRTVVEGPHVIELDAERYTIEGEPQLRINFATDGKPVREISGRLGGTLEVRQETVRDLRARYDTIAKTLAEQVNQIHEAGPSGVAFFTGTDAKSFAVSLEVIGDPTKVNAGSSGDSGDNDIALSVAALRDARVLQNGTASVSDYYRQTISGIGSEARQAGIVSSSQNVAFEAVTNQRQTVTGVSLDEELTHLVETQKAYEAAARLFSTTSEMIDVLLRM